jgi:hypothetical protein
MQLSRRVSQPAATSRRVGRARVCVVRAAKTADGPRIAVVGVTGAVGQEFLTVRRRPGRILASCVQGVASAPGPHAQVLKERNFPYSSIKMLASARSVAAGRRGHVAACCRAEQPHAPQVGGSEAGVRGRDLHDRGADGEQVRQAGSPRRPATLLRRSGLVYGRPAQQARMLS